MFTHYSLAALIAAGLFVGAGPATGTVTSDHVRSTSDDLPTTGRPLYVTNMGGGGTPTIGTFAINAAGDLTPLGDPVQNNGGTHGIVFTPDLHDAYAVNPGANRVRRYRVGSDGALSQIDDVATGRGPFAIAITPNGRTVYTGDLLGGTISAFAINADGGLDPLGAVSSGANEPKGLTVTPDGRFLYVSHGGPEGTAPHTITSFAIQSDGTLRRLGAPTPIGAEGMASAVTPDGRFLYVVCRGSDEVFGFHIGDDGSLTPAPGSPLPTADFAEGAAMSPDGHLLAVIALGVSGQSPGHVLTYAIGTDGKLVQAGDSGTMNGRPTAATFAPDGRHLYVSDYAESTVITFSIGGTGELIATRTQPAGGQRPAFHSVNVLPNQHPIASFSAMEEPVDQLRRFDASASSDSDGRVVRYDWDFGDGTSLPDGGPTPQHWYRAAGEYQVRLTVTDDEGCSTKLVYTGQSALCLGAPAASTTQVVHAN